MGNSGCGARRDAEAVKDNQRLRLNAFEGFSRLIIAFQELTKNEFGTDEVDDRVLASGTTNERKLSTQRWCARYAKGRTMKIAQGSQ